MLGTKLDEMMEFPADITWKVIGEAKPDLAEKILSVLQKNAPGDYKLTPKESSKGNWISYSIPMKLESAKQMETLYKELSDIDIVKMVI